MMEMDISVKTDHFDGPLGLLLHLIQKEEMSIRDLEINDITQQYLDYLARMQEIDFDAAGDFLHMAASLVLLKSSYCVTEEEVQQLTGDDQAQVAVTSKADLIRRLEELQRFQKMGSQLWQLERRGEDIFCKPKINRKSIVDNMLSPMDLNELTLSMMELLQKQRKKYKVVKRDRLSIKEKLEFLKKILILHERTSLSEVLEKDKMANPDVYPEGASDDAKCAVRRGNRVVTFISLLEMARLRRVRLSQGKAFSDIYIDVTKDLTDFNVDVANGFEDEDSDAGELGQSPPPIVPADIYAQPLTDVVQ